VEQPRADTEKPDEWRIDLDPMPTCRFDRSAVAHVAHEVLDELGAVGLPKTVGRQGMHVYVRIEPTTASRTYAGPRWRSPARSSARPRRRDHDVVAQGPRPDAAVRRLQPERPRPHHRGGVLRARLPDARVSTPIRWDESTTSTRATHDLHRPARYAELGDLHADIDAHVFDIARSSSGPSATSGGRAPPDADPPDEDATTHQALAGPGVVVLAELARL
jgi:hypothetical protein